MPHTHLPSCANTLQVKNNFLYSFLQERGGERDKNYALYNFSFVFAEFLGWLEVIRQEMVFVTGDDDTPLLASLIDGIKFQLTGETPIQGVCACVCVCVCVWSRFCVCQT